MLKVVIAEDMHLLRKALVELLGLEDDIEVVAEVARGEDIVPHCLALAPDVAVLDIDLPGVDGITAAAELHEQVPGCRCLILTSLAQPGQLRRALDARVSGFLGKDCDPGVLSDAIRAVAAGHRAIDPRLALEALDERPQVLTQRELEVLRLASRGEEVQRIADQLYLAAGTVRNYLTTIVMKLGARNRVDAVRIARETGWL